MAFRLQSDVYKRQRLVFMDQGQIVEEGAPDELFDNPRSPRLQAFLGKLMRPAQGHA